MKIAILFFIFGISAFAKSPSTADLKDPFQVTLVEISKLPPKNIRVVDVRESEEFNAAAIKAGKHKVETKPLSSLRKDPKKFEKFLSSVDKRKEEIIFVCANGARAKIARDHAARLGYRAKFASIVDYSKDYYKE